MSLRLPYLIFVRLCSWLVLLSRSPASKNADGKARTGRALGNPVLSTEGRVTLTDGILASAVLLGLALNAALGWWWADPAAGFVLVFYAAREVREIFAGDH